MHTRGPHMRTLHQREQRASEVVCSECALTRRNALGPKEGERENLGGGSGEGRGGRGLRRRLRLVAPYARRIARSTVCYVSSGHRVARTLMSASKPVSASSWYQQTLPQYQTFPR
eukprot:3612677-Rhodomonas_salina.1